MKKHQHKPVNLGMARDNIRNAFSPEPVVILVQFQMRTAIDKPVLTTVRLKSEVIFGLILKHLA